MNIIAHRGNLYGPFPEQENDPAYIEKALQEVDCEIDLWKLNNDLFLGHDGPKYDVSEKWLQDREYKLWIHCKNLEALEYCLKNDLHCFYHQNDDFTLTSKGYIWTYPNRAITDMSVLCMPELSSWTYVKDHAYGICTDWWERYK